MDKFNIIDNNKDSICESSKFFKNFIVLVLCLKRLINCLIFFKALVDDLDKDTLWNIMAAIMDTYDLESTTD